MKKSWIACLLSAVLLLGLTQPALAAKVVYPVLKEVSVGQGALDEAGENFDYPVTVITDGTPLDHMTLRFENTGNDNTANLVLRPEDQTEEGVYQGTLSLSAYAQEGTYVLTKATLRSENGDYRYYCLEEDLPGDPDENRKVLPQMVRVKLESGVKQNDKTAPAADGCALSQTKVPAETALTLTVQVTETGSGVDYVKARFVGDNGRGLSFTLKYVDGAYVGYLSSSQLKHPGTYTLQRLMMKDRAGNRAVYTNCKDIQFTVLSD